MMAAINSNSGITLGNLLGSDFNLADTLAQLRITSLTQDSREVTHGSLFIARSGLRTHGLEYLDRVVADGAVAILAEVSQEWSRERIEGAVTQAGSDVQLALVMCDDLSQLAGMIAARFYHDPSSQMGLVGITGTNGKTSCAWLIAHALNLQEAACMIGTIGIGRPGQLSAATHTTPDAVTLQAELAEMRDQGCASVAMEVSSHAMVQKRVAGVHFDVAVFTNLSRDHLDYHGSMEAYGAAKAELFAWPGLKTAVINLDDDFAATMMNQVGSDVRLIPVSSRGDQRVGDAGVLADGITNNANGLAFDLHYMGDVCRMQSGLVGRFNVDNLLLAVAALIAMGRSLQQSVLLLSQVAPVPGRMQLLHREGVATVVIDYAHTPDALEKALLACREHTDGKLWCLFGCGGDRDQGKRAPMGRVAGQLADRLVVTNDNPRSEDPQQIADQIVEGIGAADRVQLELDRAAAISTVLQQAADHDLVLIAGKGHENYQEIDGQRLHFSDAEVVEHYFAEVSA